MLFTTTKPHAILTNWCGPCGEALLPVGLGTGPGPRTQAGRVHMSSEPNRDLPLEETGLPV